MSVVNILSISIILLLLSVFLYKKGEFELRRIDAWIIFMSPLFLTVSSLSVVVKKIGGTVMSNIHGWPHFYLTYHVMDVIDGFLIQEWNFISGGLFIYPISNYVFYLSAVSLSYLLIRRSVKSEKKITIALLLTVCIMAMPLLFSQNIKELRIKQEIKKANYCQDDNDCLDAGGQCPFDCYAYVNKNEVGRISGLINSYRSSCVYSCISCPEAVCDNGKCQTVCKN